MSAALVLLALPCLAGAQGLRPYAVVGGAESPPPREDP
jgi:hypothetical protein